MVSLGLLIKFIGSMCDLIIPYALGYMIDGYKTSTSRSGIYIWGGVMLASAVGAFAFNILANRISAVTAGRVTRTLRHDLFKKISYLSASGTDKFTIPSLISRLTADTYNINQLVSRLPRIGVRAPILLIGGMIFTLTLDPVLTLVLVGTLPLIAVVVYFVTKASLPLYKKVQEMLDRMTRTVQENFTGVRVVKALSKTEYEKKKFASDNDALTAAERRAELIMAISNPTTTVILNVGLTLVVLVGAFRVDSHLTTPGNIISFQTYFTIILNAMLSVTRVFIMCSKGAASASRITEVLDAEDDLPVSEREKGDGEYHIEFRNVTFSYNKNEPNLKDVSFRLKRGETLGIIGSTGSGKSTLIALLNRFYDVDEGAIYINGTDVRAIPKPVLASMFGNAFQNDFIVSGDIGDNVDYYRSLGDELIESAMRSSCAYEFVSAYPDGTAHPVAQRGSNLSGGQKQRLLISRAIAGEPEILVLDDSSSALDYKTDSILRRSLHENYGFATKIIVTQRISSIRNADLILVLDDGIVIGKGTHEQLMENCGEYRTIAEMQMGGDVG